MSGARRPLGRDHHEERGSPDRRLPRFRCLRRPGRRRRLGQHRRYRRHRTRPRRRGGRHPGLARLRAAEEPRARRLPARLDPVARCRRTPHRGPGRRDPGHRRRDRRGQRRRGQRGRGQRGRGRRGRGRRGRAGRRRYRFPVGGPGGRLLAAAPVELLRPGDDPRSLGQRPGAAPVPSRGRPVQRRSRPRARDRRRCHGATLRVPAARQRRFDRRRAREGAPLRGAGRREPCASAEAAASFPPSATGPGPSSAAICCDGVSSTAATACRLAWISARGTWWKYRWATSGDISPAAAARRGSRPGSESPRPPSIAADPSRETPRTVDRSAPDRS